MFKNVRDRPGHVSNTPYKKTFERYPVEIRHPCSFKSLVRMYPTHRLPELEASTKNSSSW